MPPSLPLYIQPLIRVLSALALTLLLCTGAQAQDGAGVDLKVLQWGVGGAARPGGWIGVQVQVTDLGQTTREVLLELAMPDPDGDTTLFQGTLAVGGEKKPTWIYARLPFSAATMQEFIVTAHTVAEPSSAQRAAGVTSSGELLGRAKFNVPAPLDARVGLFGVVGRNLAGLRNFSTDAGYNSGYAPMAHERVELVGMTVSTLPDRWMGLSQMDCIIWTGTGPDLEPTDLPDDRARAIREWVMRGGHLVVVLPAVGQTWTNPAQPLADIFPRVSVQRLENVDLNPYRPLLTDNDTALPTSAVVQVLEPLPGAKPGEATRILAGPDGRSIVTSRTVGCGTVTVIGLDVASQTLNALNAVKPDVFWNRVLGRRGRLISDAEVAKSREPGFKGPKNFTKRQQRALDQDIPGLINKTGQAFAGVMLAFVLFALYWVAAGPLGFWYARKKEAARHAWVSFVAVGLAFTAVAWGGATLLKPGKADAQHLTIIDHVYGQDTERAKVWMSVLLPRFGMMEVGIGNPTAAADPKNPIFNTLAPWDAAPSELAAATSSSFADSQAYGENGRAPHKVLTPARSTTKNYVGEWLGGPVWKMPLPYSDDGADAGALTLTPDETPRGWRVGGTLKHELPTSLKDIYVLVIRGQRPVRAQESYIGQLQTDGSYYQLAEWKPGDVLAIDPPGQPWYPLSTPGRTSSLLTDLVGQVSDNYDPMAFNPSGTRSTTGGGNQPVYSPTSVSQRLTALSLYGVLEPPDARSDNRQVLAQRADVHRFDLSKWFTRPCVIVIGQMENAPSPVPLTLSGEPMGTTGRTVVRWIYPLPDNPPRFTGN